MQSFKPGRSILTFTSSTFRIGFLTQREIHPKRHYRSPNYPPPPTYTPFQQKILNAALELVPSKGFTIETLSEGAKKAGYLEITHNLFPRGTWSLVEYHLISQRERLSSIPLEDRAGVGKTIRKLCVERLKGNEDIIRHWQEVY
jgi:ubiquinone biosynthesis protein COQ9